MASLSLLRKVLIGAITLLGASIANATIIYTPGNFPQPNEENILYNQPGLLSGPALTVTGTTQQSGFTISFNSNENLFTPAQGQSRVQAQDGGFALLNFTLPGATLQDVIFNLNSVNQAAGTATVTVTEFDGGGSNFALALGNGSNFLTIFGINGDLISSVRISSSIDITDNRQVRVSGAAPRTPPNNVPEPSTLLLVSSLLMLTGVVTRRRKATK